MRALGFAFNDGLTPACTAVAESFRREPTPIHDALAAKFWPAPKSTRRDARGRFLSKEQS